MPAQFADADATFMRQALASAAEGVRLGHGGPFGACVVREGRAIAVAHNTVLRDRDPTAHAEMNALRAACRALGTHDLSGGVIYATAEPCPMCLGAIAWARLARGF
ncbi:MAG: nucleoside deaminase, partial [Verrucomicrobiae bacterium]|nr:nucleoside deaminase [Verrucomicrobiae bacterium]